MLRDVTPPPDIISIDDVRAAAEGLQGITHRTPVLTSRTLDARSGATVFVKAECFQRTGAFKLRGAYNRLSALTADERAGGVVAYSSGNHAQAVAYAASLIGAPALILMPSDAPQSKVDATLAYGAEVERYDRYTDDRAALATEVADVRGAVVVPPYDDPLVMAGQGTAALELLEDVPGIDTLIVPVGGGGLISGCATAAKAIDPKVIVLGVEPAVSDDTRRSLAAGERVRVEVAPTVADGQQLATPGELTFEVVRRLVDDVLVVDDAQIVDAMRFCFERMRVVAEPSGATGIAAVLASDGALASRRVGVILSGGNVDAARFAALTGRDWRK